MTRKRKPSKPALVTKDGWSHMNVESSSYCNIMLRNITATYTVFDLATKISTIRRINHVHLIEPRDFRKALQDPTHTYSILYGVTKLIKRKGEKYLDDICFISVGGKGASYGYDRLITSLEIDNYGKYVFWEVGVDNTDQPFKYLKNCRFHPEEVTRFNKDMATLFRVVARNPRESL